jgi:hydroxymethylbilane synthase
MMPEAWDGAFYLMAGTRARHHLLRVLLGLDSPLPGESDIVGQAREAIRRAHVRSESALSHALRAALRTQKRVRRESGLSGARISWAESVSSAAMRGAVPGGGSSIVLWGCGRLSRDVARRLVRDGVRTVPLSRRAGKVDPEWAVDPGLHVLPPERLPAALAAAHAVVLSSPLAPRQAEAVCRAARAGRLRVIDVEGSSGRALSPLGASYLSLDRAGLTMSGARSAALAAAEELAVRKALERVGRTARVAAPAALRLGARRSRLSLAQVEEVRGYLKALAPLLTADLRTSSSPGDRDKQTPLPDVRADDFFTRDLDEALRSGAIDVAVHSAKDLPECRPAGLALAAVTPSLAPWDCLVTRDRAALAALPAGARVGTSSERRRAGLAALRPDLQAGEIRGDVPDRIAQLDAGRFDALILAAVGLIRLGMVDRISQVFAAEELGPAPGQGQLALVVRESDADVRRFLAPLDLGEWGWLPWR